MEVKVLLFAAIIGCNAYFLISWTRNIVPLIVQTLRRRLTSRRYQTRPSLPDKLNSVDFASSHKQSLSNLSVSEVSGRNSRLSDVVPDNSPYLGESSLELPHEVQVTPFAEE